MAKKAPSETNLPLILTLIFFVLTTIGAGVFCYVLYDAQAAKDAKLAEMQKQVDGAQAKSEKAELTAKLVRVYAGLDRKIPKAAPAAAEAEAGAAPTPPTPGAGAADDLSVVLNQVRENDEAHEALKALVAETRRRAPDIHRELLESFKEKVIDEVKKNPNGVEAAVDEWLKTALGPDDMVFWSPEANPSTHRLAAGPTSDLLSLAVRARVVRDMALRLGEDERNGYKAQAKQMKEAELAYEKERKTFTDKVAEIGKEVAKQVEPLEKALTARAQEYANAMKTARAEVATIEKARLTMQRELVAARDDLTRLKQDNEILRGQLAGAAAVGGGGVAGPGGTKLSLGDPKGKILSKNRADGTVVIDVGDNDRVREGAKFSVMPSDFPRLGEQSRMRRDPATGKTRLTPKGSIEVIRTLGPTSSLARIVTEDSEVRDPLLPGDLIYNPSWNRGQVEHVALIGVFDVNGTGRDDLNSVIQELRRNGVQVDAVWNPSKKNAQGGIGGWDGTVSDRTRKAIRGYFPSPNGADPNDPMSALNSRFAEGMKDLQNKGMTVVNMWDYFPLMGIRVRQNVTDDTIRQASRHYLEGAVGAPAPNQ